MKRALCLIFLFYFNNNLLFGQSITSFLMNANDVYEYYHTHQGKVHKIVVDEIDGIYKEKWVYHFPEPGKIQGELYRNKELFSMFIYEFDSLKQKIKSIVDFKIPAMGWQREIHTYQYQQGKIIIENHYNRNNSFIRKVKYEYNDWGHLWKLSICDSLDQVESYETADYDYTQNIYVYRVFNSIGRMQLEEKNNFNPDTTANLRNEYGDLINRVLLSSSSLDAVSHTFEYEYDPQGNWISRKSYFVRKNKKSKLSHVKRTIEYE